MPPLQPVNNPVPGKQRHFDIWLIISILLFLVVAGLSGLSVWSYNNYIDQKTNVDSKIASAVADAKNTQSVKDQNSFTAREKEPNRQFVGPIDYGRVTFDYPKTWSVYVDKDASDGGNFEAYLNPTSVPPISDSQQFAIRVVIEQNDYDKVVSSYDSSVKRGDLQASSVKVNGNNGTRLDGTFSQDIRGSAVIFKIRDNTLTIRTDALTFEKDFNKLVQTIEFKP